MKQAHEELSPDSRAAGRRIVNAYRRRWGRDPEIVVRSPGRVALLGAHVDYSDGWVMPGAIEPSIWLAAGADAEPKWRLRAEDLSAETELDLGALPTPPGPAGRTPVWFDYPAGVAWVLTGEGRPPKGLKVVYGGDLPAGGGVSSSAAVEVAFLIAACGDDLAGDRARAHAAQLARRVENDYLGLHSGLMDPYAILMGRRDHLVFLDCREIRHELLPLSSELRVWVVDSGVQRRLVSSGFNDRKQQCRQAVEQLRPLLGKSVTALRDVSPRDLQLYAHRLPRELRLRARHAVEEMARVRAAANDLKAGRLERFGRAMNASHVGSRDFYEVTVPEIDELCAAAWSVPECLGAKLMGGGFGGCVAVLAPESAMAEIQKTVVDAFRRRFGRLPEGRLTRLADGAGRLPADSSIYD